MMHPAFAGVGALFLAGLIGFVIIEVGVLIGGPRRTRAEASRRKTRESSGVPKTSVDAALSAEDLKILMRDATEALTRETSELRAEVHTAIEELRGSTRSEISGGLESQEVAVLHDAALSIAQSVPKLAQIIDALSAVAAHSNHQFVSTASASAVAEELDEVLREITAQTAAHPISGE
jgi:hypothetical protein